MSRPLDAFNLMVEYQAWARSAKRERMNDLLREHNQDNAIIVALTYSVTDPFWVSADFTALVNAASPTFPKSPLTLTEAPCPQGLVLFDGKVNVNDLGPDPDREPATGLVWTTGLLEDGRQMLAVNTFIDYDDLEDHPAPVREFVGLSRLPDSGGGWIFDAPVEEGAKAFRTLATLRVFWALCRQRLALTRRENAPRGAARQAIRAGMEHVPEIAIVTLRRPAGNRENSTDGPGFVDWSHRWIVGGHWRNQWVPSVQQHEPRWISPYVKGPEDKPLVTDRVYQLVR